MNSHLKCLFEKKIVCLSVCLTSFESADTRDLGLMTLFSLFLLIQIQPEEAAGFSIARETGEIRLTQLLDFESARFYNLVVVAKDGGSPPLSATTEVVVVVEVR